MTNKIIYPHRELKKPIDNLLNDFFPDETEFSQFLIGLLSNKDVLIYLSKNINKEKSMISKQGIIGIIKDTFPEWSLYIMRKYNYIKDYDVEETEKAIDIVTNQDPLKYCLDVLKKQHIGEEHILLLCIVSGVSPGLRDRKMLMHIMGVGESGKGKTDCMESVGKIFSKYELVISASPKNIFYKAKDDLLIDNGILFFPENDIKDIEFQALERVLTDDKDIVPKHETVINQYAKSLEIKQINVMWRNSVGTSDDEDNQLNNRYYIFNVDESLEQDKEVYNHIIGNWNVNQKNIDKELNICKAITDLIKSDSVKVMIPYIRGIDLSFKGDRRTIKKFLRLVSIITYFYRFQRIKSGDMILSEVIDFNIANLIWESINKYESSKLPEYETSIIEELAKHKGISVTELAGILNKDVSNLNKKVNSMEERGLLYTERITESTYQGETRVTKPKKLCFGTKTPQKSFRFGSSPKIIDLAVQDLKRLNIEELQIPEKRFGGFGSVLQVREQNDILNLFEKVFENEDVSHFFKLNQNINNNIYNNIYIYTIYTTTNKIGKFILLPNQEPLPYQNSTKTNQDDIELIDMEDLI